MDDRASKVFHRLGQDANLRGDEVGTLAIFILSLMHRTPAGLADVAKVASNIHRQAWEELKPRYEDLRGPNDPRTVEEYEASEGPDADVRAFYRNIPSFIVNETIIQYMAQMHWRIFTRPSDAPKLLLSDDPLIRTNGIKKPDGHLAFPLSPERLVFAGNTQHFTNFVERSSMRELFTNANIQAVESARHFVVSCDRAQRRFVINRFGNRPRPTLGEQMLREK